MAEMRDLVAGFNGAITAALVNQQNEGENPPQADVNVGVNPPNHNGGENMPAHNNQPQHNTKEASATHSNAANTNSDCNTTTKLNPGRTAAVVGRN